jgi:ATP-binding cassette subfamily B multidrug efflux pump
VQQQQSRLSTLAQESFSGIRVLKAYAKESDGRGALRGSRCGLPRAQPLTRPRWTRSSCRPSCCLIGLSTVLTILVGAASSCMDGDPTVTVGNIAEFVIYVNMLTWPFASVGWVTSLIQQASASMDAHRRIPGCRRAITNCGRANDRGVLPCSEVQGAITFKNVSYTYPDTGITALATMSRFHVSPQAAPWPWWDTPAAARAPWPTSSGANARCHGSGHVLIDGVPIRAASNVG